MNKDKILELFMGNYGKIIGMSIGLIFSVLVIWLGFIKTIFICLCVFMGYFLGNKIDSKQSIWELLDRILPLGKFK